MDTETRPPKNLWIDKMETSKALSCMLANQSEAIKAIENSLVEIEIIVNKIYAHLKKSKKGRIIYCGAGTSGRIAAQDGVELYPTFGWKKSRVDFIIPGGKKGLVNSLEGAEDDVKLAKEMLKRKCITSEDVVICLAASGNTEFTNEIAKLSSELNALTVGISNNSRGKILKFVDFRLLLDTGFELVAGSTRLKAGTAQKISLNLISTMVMTKLGFVKNGLMVSMVPLNQKLKKRAEAISRYLKS